ncbi:hypothetical protein K456DRAFT_218775 [Colletotrichum gloeosporioides 23]|nr:hypothetical protein K456DRAFT_218775 [Colletotrichum gloeosporioides 23]
MTTAHRPTFDPARGKEALRGPAYHQRLLPAHTQLKFRQTGQGGEADDEPRDLRAELLAAEAAHFAKKNGGAPPPSAADDDAPAGGVKRALEAASQADGEEDFETKRRRILEESRDIDAEAAMMRRQSCSGRWKRSGEEERERDIALGNPLLNKPDFAMKRRWDDDVVFKNQARGTEEKKGKEFINDLLRSDFHKRFMSKYVR